MTGSESDNKPLAFGRSEAGERRTWKFAQLVKLQTWAKLSGLTFTLLMPSTRLQFQFSNSNSASAPCPVQNDFTLQFISYAIVNYLCDKPKAPFTPNAWRGVALTFFVNAPENQTNLISMRHDATRSVWTGLNINNWNDWMKHRWTYHIFAVNSL